jgi:WXXGXW repeat (2 copies)
MNRKTALLIIVALGLALSACGGGGAYYVRVPPPAPRYGVIGVAPGPGYVWADGFWDWRGGNWFWVRGRWQRPPRRHATWVPGHWVSGRHGYRRVPGHWR